MACYHPRLRVEDLSRWTRAVDGHYYHPATIVTPDKFDLESYHEKTQRWAVMEIPCKECIGCRLDYSREWANRGYLEAKLWDHNWFVTLTYNEDTITIPELVECEDGMVYHNGDFEEPWTGTLIPRDLQLFMKKLRKKAKERYGDDNIRFMACGEYGSQTERPHYHLIIFNLELMAEPHRDLKNKVRDKDLYNPKIINKNIYYQSKLIEECWTKEGKKKEDRVSLGISNVSEASWNTIAYTARYITKKINGPTSEEYYKQKGKSKEFFVMSRRPGIGEGYYRKHWEEIYKHDKIYIKNKTGIQASKPPKYFDKLLEKEHPEIWEKIKMRRLQEARNTRLIKTINTSLLRQDLLEVEERAKSEATQALVREFERHS